MTMWLLRIDEERWKASLRRSCTTYILFTFNLVGFDRNFSFLWKASTHVHDPGRQINLSGTIFHRAGAGVCGAYTGEKDHFVGSYSGLHTQVMLLRHHHCPNSIAESLRTWKRQTAGGGGGASTRMNRISGVP